MFDCIGFKWLVYCCDFILKLGDLCLHYGKEKTQVYYEEEL